MANVESTKLLVAPGETRRLSDLTNEDQQLVLVFEVNSEMAIEWMSPVDGNFETVQQLLDSEKLPHPGIFQVTLVDGSTHSLVVQEHDHVEFLQMLTGK